MVMQYSILRFAVFCLMKVKKKIQKKQNYESDEVLVKVIAKHYDILKLLRYDTNDDNMPKDYNYITRNKNNNPHKYIATAIEACLGAIYIQKRCDITPIINIAKKWIEIIDSQPDNT